MNQSVMRPELWVKYCQIVWSGICMHSCMSLVTAACLLSSLNSPQNCLAMGEFTPCRWEDRPLNVSFCSMATTRQPLSRAALAAAQPAVPRPTTTMSASTSSSHVS